MGKTEILTTNEHIKKNLYICHSSFPKKMFLSYEKLQRSKEICCAVVLLTHVPHPNSKADRTQYT